MSGPDRIVHAGLVALYDRGGWRSALIRGASGVGKSSLALRALAAGFRLVADDRVILWTSGGRLFGRAPDPLAGLIEVRGQDILTVASLPLAEVTLVVDALGAGAEPDRLPEPVSEYLLGTRVPLVQLALQDASAPAKLAVALRRL